MAASVRDQVREFVTSNFPIADPDKLADDVDLLDARVIDSTGVLEIINFIEPTFSITVRDDEMVPDNLASIANLVAYIARKQA